MLNEPAKISLDELAERIGVPVRTIRFYITEGLLPGPVGRGKAATYGRDHLLRLSLIRQLVGQRVPLAEVRAQVSGLSGAEIEALLAETEAATAELDRARAEPSPKEYVAALLNRARAARAATDLPESFSSRPAGSSLAGPAAATQSAPRLPLPAPAPPGSAPNPTGASALPTVAEPAPASAPPVAPPMPPAARPQPNPPAPGAPPAESSWFQPASPTDRAVAQPPAPSPSAAESPAAPAEGSAIRKVPEMVELADLSELSEPKDQHDRYDSADSLDEDERSEFQPGGFFDRVRAAAARLGPGRAGWRATRAEPAAAVWIRRELAPGLELNVRADAAGHYHDLIERVIELAAGLTGRRPDQDH